MTPFDPRKHGLYIPRKFARLFWMLQYLQKYGHLNFETAERHIGVPLRTYRRYVAQLRALGVNIITESGHHGNGLGWIRYGGFDEHACIIALREDIAA